MYVKIVCEKCFKLNLSKVKTFCLKTRVAVLNVKSLFLCETVFKVSIGLVQALQKYAQNTHDQTAVSYSMQGIFEMY